MDRVGVETAQNVRIDFETGGIGKRVIAALIDYLLLFAYVTGMMVVFGEQLGGPGLLGLVVLPAFLYFLLCEVFTNGQSVGKRLTGIRVARLDGSRPRLGDYLLRWVLRPIDLTLTSGVAALMSVLATRRGQRLGDLAAGTTVVKVQQQSVAQDTLFARLDDDYEPTFRQARRLTDEDVTVARDVLTAYRKHDESPAPLRLSRDLKARLEAKMNVSSDLPAPHFLETVLQDYNHLHGRLASPP
jgi:uncharacterized RDD family membrane protein YckC